jgi:hypothetical protein
MAEQYSQTLISTPKDFVPSPVKVREFLSAMVALEVVPGTTTVLLVTPSGKTREYPNPFGGKPITVEIANRKELENLSQIDEALASLQDYRLTIAGQGRPSTPPLPIVFDEPYCIDITCHVASKTRCTSNLHQESGKNLDVAAYGEPCPSDAKLGLFSNLNNLQVIEVPNAGCARFWIEFQLGKFLFPKVETNLELLHPAIVRMANQTFGVTFAQGCHWG